MEKISLVSIVHWVSYCCYLFIFSRAGLDKIIQKPGMMKGMQAFGFDKQWTLVIGYAEVIGALALIAGIWNHSVKNAAVIFLFPFAIGAFTTHLAHREYHEFYEALACCILSVVLLATDRHFKILL